MIRARNPFLAKEQCKSILMFDNKKLSEWEKRVERRSIQKLKNGEKKTVASKHAAHTNITWAHSTYKRTKAWSSNTSASSVHNILLKWQSGSQSARQTNRHQDTHEKHNRKKKKKSQQQQQRQTKKKIQSILSNLLYNNLGRFPCSIEAYELWAKIHDDIINI